MVYSESGSFHPFLDTFLEIVMLDSIVTLGVLGILALRYGGIL